MNSRLDVEQFRGAADGEKVAWHNCLCSIFPHQSDEMKAKKGTPHLYAVSGVPCCVLNMIGDE